MDETEQITASANARSFIVFVNTCQTGVKRLLQEH